ncbi:ABC transporter ATP-binding protein [Pseudonocardia oroxyli]|uniref:Peptide/nickel transport system ATP-binding protein n=1 Tax=Pseudonocardia oroxyli TaxID=366584 RepID=A0A1G7DSA0_PSEOR|nr:ABC transporter ATP-binding protein [Pseudonocardia oroxyli]SDE53755.1 peptide/nickel transport system ATP-binding protein [Pseudonocardia oroxyli]
MSLLEVRDLSVHLDRPLVSGVDLTLERGGTLGVVGESGSGKSLTCRSVLGILPPELRTGAETSIRFDGVELTGLDAAGWLPYRADRIGAVFQDPGSYLDPSERVGRQLAEVLRVRGGLGRRAARDRARELFAEVGLHASTVDQYPYELSGGMQQRVLIAIAVSREPDLLIADEATTALDVTVQAEVLDLLADLRERHGLALVLVSHDLAVVAQVCEEVVVMRHGRVVERGTAAQVLRAPEHPYTRSLVAAHARFGIEHVREARLV